MTHLSTTSVTLAGMRAPSRDLLLLTVLVLTSVAYAVAPQAASAPIIKPVPALCASAVVGALGGRGWRLVAVGLLVSAAGDVAVEFESLTRLGTLAFAVAVLIMGEGIRRQGRGSWWRGILLAGAWAGVSGTVVVPELGDRLAAGLIVLTATALFLVAAGRAGGTVALGATLIAVNFTLFAVDAFVQPLPRWLVIGVYDLGLLLLATGARGRHGSR